MDASQLAEHAEINGTYRLVRLLGQGGMGAVWEAVHMRLPKRVAIKFLLGPGLSNPEILARFRREAEIASRLEHPNIVEVHDYNTLEDGTPYLVMERLQGRDLRARLDEGPVPLDEAREIIRQVASALQLAHREGVIHRDLKPENIFLCAQSDGTTRIKVLDFGISKLQDSATMMTQENTILGTPNYMAPEQAMGQHSRIDGRTDLFSLAAIFYEMLTGETIFRGQTLVEVLYKVTHYEPAPLEQKLPSIPPAISTAVAMALAKDPGRRQLSVLQFVSSFDARIDSAPGPGANGERMAAPAFGGTLLADGPGQGRVPTAPIDHSHPASPIPTVPPQPRGRRSSAGWLIALVVLAAGGTGAYVLAQKLPLNTGTTGEEQASAAEAGSQPTEPATPSTHPAPPTEEPAAPPAGDTPSQPPPTEPSDAPDPGADSSKPEPAQDSDLQNDAPETQTDDPPTPAETDRPTAGSRPPKTNEAAPPRPRLSPLLQDAEAALGRGAYDEAVRLAKRSLQDGKDPNAFAIMAQAHCGQRDIGLANAMLRNLDARRARQVRAYCRRHGIDLP